MQICTVQGVGKNCRRSRGSHLGPTFKERHCINGIPRYIYAVSPPGEALTDLRFVFYPPTPPNSSEMLFSPAIPEVKTFADRKETRFSCPKYYIRYAKKLHFTLTIQLLFPSSYPRVKIISICKIKSILLKKVIMIS